MHGAIAVVFSILCKEFKSIDLIESSFSIVTLELSQSLTRLDASLILPSESNIPGLTKFPSL